MKKVPEKRPLDQPVFPVPLSEYAPPPPGSRAPSCQTQLMEIGVEGIRRAEANIKRWGEQDPQTLMICMAEELGEVARSILRPRQAARRESSKYAGSLDVREVESEALDLCALCLQIVWLMREDRIHPRKTGGSR
jgi:NTP pyrophosphatase (non-canonical NTP hydrolase)